MRLCEWLCLTRIRRLSQSTRSAMVDSRTVAMSRVPILVILGSTGTGKSRLGIELAQRFAGEVISADSMQVYRGLDIITAKVTKEERSLVPHHMLDLVNPMVNFCVVDYRKQALPIMNDLVGKRKMPIIVGGTNYYIESLLWQILVEDPEASGNTMKRHDSSWRLKDSEIDCENKTKCVREGETTSVVPAHQHPDDAKDEGFVLQKKMKYEDSIESNEALHHRLVQVDPERARRLHPNNRRKVIRSLEVFENHGITHTDILKAQRQAGGCGLGGPLRYPNSKILWLRCDQEVLHERLEQRVDKMVEAGLVQELQNFHENYNRVWIKMNESPDYTKGIFQSIGFKEFHEYLILSDEEKNSKKGEKLLEEGIKDLKLVTKRYAKRQERWVMNRFVRRTDRQVPPVYELDCTNLDDWQSKVFEPAVAIINAEINGEIPSQKPCNEDVLNHKCTDSSNEESYWCETCARLLIGEAQWQAHKDGGKHKKMAEKKRKIRTTLIEEPFFHHPLTTHEEKLTMHQFT